MGLDKVLRFKSLISDINMSETPPHHKTLDLDHKTLDLDKLLRFKSLILEIDLPRQSLKYPFFSAEQISDINTSETPGAHSLGHRLQAGAGGW